MSIHSFLVDCNKRRPTISTRDRSNPKYHLILEAAVKVFARQGFHQSTISQIAREAGVADGTIYLYFKNKDDIMVQFFTFKTSQAFDEFQEVVDRAGSSEDKLKSLIRHHLEVFARDLDMAVVYQAEARRKNALVEKQFKEISKKYLDIVGEIIDQGQVEGKLRKDLYMGLAKRFVLGAVDEVINTWVLSGGKYDLASMADPLVDLIIRGLGSR